MDHSQKRCELSRKYLSDQIKLEMLRSKTIDRQISVFKKEILEIRQQNISMRLQNNTLRLEEPNVNFVDSKTFKETEGIVLSVKSQHQNEKENLNHVSEQMKTVTDVYKHLSDGIKISSENLKDCQQYKENLNEFYKNIESKRVELTQRQEALGDSRKKWNDEIHEKDSLLEILRGIEEKLDLEVKRAGIETSTLPKSLNHIKTDTKIKDCASIFKKPRTPKKISKNC